MGLFKLGFVLCVFYGFIASVQNKGVIRQRGDRNIILNVGKVRGAKVEFPDNDFRLKPVERYSGMQYGTLQGFGGNGLRFIPPSNNLRRWGNSVKSFTTWSKVCPQNAMGHMKNLADGYIRQFERIIEKVNKQTEDCLCLNLWSPIPGKATYNFVDKIIDDRLCNRIKQMISTKATTNQNHQNKCKSKINISITVLF